MKHLGLVLKKKIKSRFVRSALFIWCEINPTSQSWEVNLPYQHL